MTDARPARCISIHPDVLHRGTVYTIDDAWFEGGSSLTGGSPVPPVLSASKSQDIDTFASSPWSYRKLAASLESPLSSTDGRQVDARVLKTLAALCESHRLRLVIANFPVLEHDGFFDSQIDLPVNAVLLDIKDHTQDHNGDVAGIALATKHLARRLAQHSRLSAHLFWVTSNPKAVKDVIEFKSSPNQQQTSKLEIPENLRWALRGIPFVSKPAGNDGSSLEQELRSFLQYFDAYLPKTERLTRLADAMVIWYTIPDTSVTEGRFSGHAILSKEQVNTFPLYELLPDKIRMATSETNVISGEDPNGVLLRFFNINSHAPTASIDGDLLRALLNGLAQNVELSPIAQPATLPTPAPLFLLNIGRFLHGCNTASRAESASGALHSAATGNPLKIRFESPTGGPWRVDVVWSDPGMAARVFAAFVNGKADGAAGALRDILAWSASAWKTNATPGRHNEIERIYSGWVSQMLPGFRRLDAFYPFARMNVRTSQSKDGGSILALERAD